MRQPNIRNAPLTAAEALREEFVQLNGPLPDYHAWLNQLPEEPRLWLLQKDHLKDPALLAEKLLTPATPLAQFLRDQLNSEIARSLGDLPPSTSREDSALEPLVNVLNRLITGGRPLYDRDRFTNVALSPPTEGMARSPLEGRRLEILNRLLLEEALPDAIARVWDTLAGVCALLHTHSRAALCFSGGGIRSATFALGVLQGLAAHDLLPQFDYLSTVSGGGYIGAWLTSWIHHAGSPQEVFQALNSQAAVSPTAPEPEPIRHLRRFSNYLTPRLGVFSADTWTLIGTYLRNLLLNWVAFVPLLIALLAVPRLGVAALRLPAPTWALTMLLLAGFILTACGIAYGAMQRPSLAETRRARSRFWNRHGDQTSFLLCCLAPLWLAAVCFTTFWVWLPAATFQLPPWWTFALAGPCLHLGGWSVSVLWLRRFSLAELGAVLLTGAVGGILLWVPARANFTNFSAAPDLELYACFAVPVFLSVFLVTGTIFIGLASWRTTDADREWWARMGAWILLSIVFWMTFSGLVLFGPLGLLALPPLLAALGGVPGLLIVLAGSSSRTPSNQAATVSLTWTARMLDWGTALAAPLFVLFLAALLSLGTTVLLRFWPALQGAGHLALVHQTPLWLNAALIAGATAFGLVMSGLININKFSLHSVYRNRLIRAYLGASNPRRHPNPFTGFDPRDNLRLFRLAGQRPLQVMNMALNLVSGENLAWQQRKAETFTASALHAGAYRLGYRRAREYAQNEHHEGLSLGTAITISGAAASPNQGYHSSPIVALLLTLFNVRLGAWLGNPGPAGNRSYTQSAPRNAALHIAKEALGLTNDENAYVYLSDGSHFENLGLYEMVARRCHYIVVSDAGADPDCALEDLGNAIRKVRIDLGVPIEMNRFDIHSPQAGLPGRHCAIGEIQYDKADGPQARRGLLIYLKPALTGDEPVDVFNYKQTSPQFPHESTSDQWFSESQFESYRTLGLHTITSICQDWEHARQQFGTSSPLALFVRQTFKYLEIPFPPKIQRHLEALGSPGGVPPSARPASIQAAPAPAPSPAAPKSF